MFRNLPMSLIKSIFWYGQVKWSLATLKAQSGPIPSLPFSFVPSATLPTPVPSTATSSLLQNNQWYI